MIINFKKDFVKEIKYFHCQKREIFVNLVHFFQISFLQFPLSLSLFEIIIKCNPNQIIISNLSKNSTAYIFLASLALSVCLDLYLSLSLADIKLQKKRRQTNIQKRIMSTSVYMKWTLDYLKGQTTTN